MPATVLSEPPSISHDVPPPTYSEAVGPTATSGRRRRRVQIDSALCTNDAISLTAADLDRVRDMASEALSDTTSVAADMPAPQPAAAPTSNRTRRRWRRKKQSDGEISASANTSVVATGNTLSGPPNVRTSSLLETYWVKFKTRLPPYRWGTPGTPDYETRRQKFIRSAQYVGMAVFYGLVFAVIIVGCVALLVAI